MKRARPSSDSPSSPSNILSGEQRINKLLAAAGLGSRRQVDELIEQGRVEVNGVICDQLGMKIDTDTAKITVDGTALKKFRPVYFALNKPSGVLCTNRDPQGRRRAIDFIPGHERLFPVGRLDAASTGLLLLTNDGELTQQLTHPKHGVPKTYQVVVAGQVEPDEVRRLRRGIYLSDGIARVDNVKIRHVRKNSTELEITLTEGKNRELRRVLARVGHKVVALNRISIGPLKLGSMPEAAYRPLSKDEIADLYHAAEDARKARKLRKKEDVARSQEKAARAEKKLASGETTPSARNRDESSSEKPVRSPRLRGDRSSETSLPSPRLRGEGTSDSSLPSPRLRGEGPGVRGPSSSGAKKLGKARIPDRTSKASSSDRTTESPSSQPSEPRDPFAWDDDDELLKASPFAPNQRFASSDEDDDDDEWEVETDDEDQDDSDLMSDGIEGESLLVDDRAGMRVGRVLDYDEAGESPSKPAASPRKKGAFREGRRPSKKSAQREPRSAEQGRGSTKSPRPGKKKFGSAKSTKSPGIKKGGFKKGGFKKGAPKRGAPKRGAAAKSGRSSKGSSPKSSGRGKRRS